MPDGPAASFDIEVRAGGEVLWSGPMRVSRLVAGRFERRKTEAPAASCGDGGTSRVNAAENTTLSVNVQRYLGAPIDDAAFTLSVTWVRPGEGDACGGGRATLTSGISQQLRLAPGQSLTINGDSGLTVRLRRR